VFFFFSQNKQILSRVIELIKKLCSMVDGSNKLFG